MKSRDYIAIKAMQSLIMSTVEPKITLINRVKKFLCIDHVSVKTFNKEDIAQYAYVLADQMLKESSTSVE
jgi:hypothetical protein